MKLLLNIDLRYICSKIYKTYTFNISVIFAYNHSDSLNLSKCSRDTWLAQLLECMTLDLGVVASSPTLGVVIT